MTEIQSSTFIIILFFYCCMIQLFSQKKFAQKFINYSSSYNFEMFLFLTFQILDFIKIFLFHHRLFQL